jgi:HEPN domain-containing protein
LKNKKVLYALFLCHLCVEKAIKAHIVVKTTKVPPRVHNLSYLLEFTELKLSENQLKLCDTLMFYQIEGRYPESYPKVPKIEEAIRIYEESKDLFLWIKEKL